MKQDKAKSTNRTEKLSSLLQQQVGEIIQQYLSGQAGLATVSKVEVSRDTKWAKIWVSIVGGDDDQIFGVLQKNIYDIQGELNRRLDLKMVPRLQFFLDTSPRYAQHINELIEKIHEEDDDRKFPSS
jgi:ribosome-binding factor A